MTLITMWVVAGFLMGWIAIDLIAKGLFNLTSPVIYRCAGGFVGGLIAYTILK